MADEPINIIVTDGVDPAIATKFTAIAANAREADVAIIQLQANLSRLDTNILTGLAEASATVAGALRAESIAQADLAAATARGAAADAQATLAKQRLATAAAETALAEQKLATEQEATAAAAALAAKAASAAAKAQLDLEAAMKRAERATVSHSGATKVNTLAATEMTRIVNDLATGAYMRAERSTLVLANATSIWSAILTPTGFAVTAVVVALAGYAFAVAKGEEETNKFNQAVSSTGNFAGLTADSYEQMAKRIAASTDTGIRGSRNAIIELISTGQFSSQVLEKLATAAELQARATGQNSEEVAKSYAKMADGVFNYALAYDKTHHTISGIELNRIRELEQRGDKERAEFELAAQLEKDALNQMAVTTGGMVRLWNDVKNSINGVIDSLYSLGKAQTPGEHVAELRATIARDQATVRNNDGPPVEIQYAKERIARLQPELAAAEAQQRQAQATAQAQQAQAAKNKTDQEAIEVLDRYAGKTTQIITLQRELQHIQELRRSGAAGRGGITTPDDIAKADSAETEIRTRIARLQRGIDGPQHKPKHTKEETYQEGTEKLEVDAQAQLRLAAAYQQSDLAALQARASRKALTDAVGKGATADDIAARTIASLRDEVAKLIVTNAKKTHDDEVALTTSKQYYDEVAKGNMTVAEAQQAIARETQLRPYLTAILAAQGQVQHDIAQKAYDDQKRLIDQAYEEKLREGILASNQAADDQLTLMSAEVRLRDTLGRQRAVELAQLQKKLELEHQEKGLSATPAGAAAVLKAGQTAGAQYDLGARGDSAYKKGADYGLQLAKQLQADLAYNKNRVAYYKAARDQINALEAAGTLDADKAAQARKIIAAEEASAKLQSASDFFGALAGLAGSKNKELTAIGKASAILQMSIDQGVAIMKAWASAPFPANLPAVAVVTAQTVAQIAKIAGLKDGGKVLGPGGPRDDKVLRWLSNGEFVVNAKATNDNHALLEAINSGAYSSKGHADGGYISASQGATSQVVNSPVQPNTGGTKVSVHNYGTSRISVERVTRDEIRIIAQEEAKGVVRRDAGDVVAGHVRNPNSPVSKALSNHTLTLRKR